MMIQLYETNPANLLTSIDARKALKGDACSIIRVHECLDAFNIINHSVKHARTSTTAVYVPFTAYADGASEEVEKLIKSREDEDQSIQELYDSKDTVQVDSIRTLAREKIADLEEELKKQVKEYIDIRGEALDERLKLLQAVENGMSIEHESIELDRRDNQVTRAYIAYVKEAPNQASYAV